MGPSSVTAVSPPRSFYKIIFQSIIDDHKLRIPEDFAKIYEKDLSSYATLVVPNGRVFRVRVEKAKKMLWLHNGWKGFAEYHSIRCGFFLVFDYEGNSKFKVYIFDLTATEIKYPKNSVSTCEHPGFGNKSKMLQKRGRNLSSTSTSRPKPVFSKDEVFNECVQQGEKRKMCFHSVLPEVFEFAPEFATRIKKYGECLFYKPFFENLRYNCQHKTSNKRLKENLLQNSSFSNESGIQNYTRSADKKSHLPAEDLEDTHLATPIIEDEDCVEQEEGCGFIGVSDSGILLRRSRIQEKQKALNDTLMLKLKNPYFMIILKQYDVDRTSIWIPEKFLRKHGPVLPEVATLTTPNDCRWQVRLNKIDEKVFFADGWYDFVESQFIRAGYILVFMYKGSSNFNVNIFSLANAEINYQSNRPSNLADPCFISGLENVENKKSESSSKSLKCEQIELWKTSVIHSQARCSHDSAIKYSYEEMAYAYEDRSNLLSQSPTSTRKRKHDIEFDVPKVTRNLESTATPKGKDTVLNESNTPLSTNPFCEVILRRSYVYDKATCLYFPSSFAEKYLAGVSGLITLNISNDKKWRVRFMWRNGLPKLCRGWREFVRDNSLTEGDLCIFELIESKAVVLKVTIKRSSENAIPV